MLKVTKTPVWLLVDEAIIQEGRKYSSCQNYLDCLTINYGLYESPPESSCPADPVGLKVLHERIRNLDKNC